jgi:hypothetical protein
MGKKGNGSDMQLGLTTGEQPLSPRFLLRAADAAPTAAAPVLLAMEEQPRLRALAGRCFEHAGDVEEALQLVLSSTGIQRSRCCILAPACVLWCSWWGQDHGAGARGRRG